MTVVKTGDIRKILIANRGEIACRIIRTCQQMDILTVAVYSHVDRNSLHVEMADEAYEIGGAAATDSYLNQEKILQIVKQSGADAVHPAYGFLSENTQFAQLLAEHNIIFIGPPINAIEAMGDKAKSKSLMEKAGVPLLGGYHGQKQEADFLRQQAEKIGFPVLIKAAAGGGGKGMRLVNSIKDFDNQLQAAQREAKKAFGLDHVLIEKYLQNPRHIEVQIFGDHHGNIVHLFERDCSIQRRHQKIIEEAPAPDLSEKTREKITAAAIEAAKAVDYYGAGTVEFLMDKDENFYFMEMNTRLQVEHPVTESITGQDLVAWQILVAEGRELPLTQEQIPCDGHAIEVRLYAEDPDKDFLPQAGYIRHFTVPREVRLDSAVRLVKSSLNDSSATGKKTVGEPVSIYYDPMIAKLIVHGKNRRDAVEQLQYALSESALAGLPNNLAFLHRVACHPDFIKGDLSTDFIHNHPELFEPQPDAQGYFFASLAWHISKQNNWPKNPQSENAPVRFGAWWPNQQRRYLYSVDGQKIELEQKNNQQNIYKIRAYGRQSECRIHTINDCDIKGTLDGKNFHISAIVTDKAVYLKNRDIPLSSYHKISVKNPAHPDKALSDIAGDLCAPMPATVIDILTEKGREVAAGDRLMILEAMKMEHVIRAPTNGIIDKIIAKKGDKVEEGKQLVFFVQSKENKSAPANKPSQTGTG